MKENAEALVEEGSFSSEDTVAVDRFLLGASLSSVSLESSLPFFVLSSPPSPSLFLLLSVSWLPVFPKDITGLLPASVLGTENWKGRDLLVSLDSWSGASFRFLPVAENSSQ